MGEDDENNDISLSGEEKEAPTPNSVTFDNSANYLGTTKGGQVDQATAWHIQRDTLACRNLISEVGREVLPLKDMIANLCTTVNALNNTVFTLRTQVNTLTNRQQRKPPAPAQ